MFTLYRYYISNKGDTRKNHTGKPLSASAKGGSAPSDLKPHYNNRVFSDVYLLALDNTKR
jgi:hypothetical protein